MKSKLILSALFKLRNMGLLLLMLGISAIFNNILNASPFSWLFPLSNPALITYPVSFIVYIVFVLKTLKDGEFHDHFNRKQKKRHIQDLNYMSLKLSAEARKHANATYMQKLKKVMDDKNDIVDSFFRGEHNYLKEKVVEQSLNLVVSYIKLLTNFCIRSRELSSVDIGEITNRTNMNVRKLNFTKDFNTAEDIKRAIEMDQRLLDRLKDEKKELERVSAKLDYMESTVNMLKHQVISSIETEDMIEKIETAVNEAVALDNVLEERRKSKLNMKT